MKMGLWKAPLGVAHGTRTQQFLSSLAIALRNETAVRVVGDDTLFYHMAFRHKLDGRQFAAHLILTDMGPLTVVGVGSALSQNASEMAKVRQVVNQMKRHGRRCVIVPPELFQRTVSAHTGSDPIERDRFGQSVKRGPVLA